MVTYGTCEACHRVMAPGVSCDAFAWRLSDGTPLGPRTPYTLLRPDNRLANCNDCNAPTGGYHHAYCDMDRCPHGQALACPQGCQVDVSAGLAAAFAEEARAKEALIQAAARFEEATREQPVN